MSTPEGPCSLWMPSKFSGSQKRGKKLRFPPCDLVETSPVSWPLGSPAGLWNMVLKTDHEGGSASAPPGILEVMSAITSCQIALTSKIKQVQMVVGLIRQDLDKSAPELLKLSCKWEEWRTPQLITLPLPGPCRALQTKVRAR